ncbi:MAG: hypothetical protein KAJ07_11730 [Planctomycetes bacterium]|nr:hypothetical protein [Planctomycetota bacterium]
MKKRLFVALLVLTMFSIVLSGCGKKGVPAGPVDTNKPVAEVTAEAELMTVDQLREMATKYFAAIKAKSAELEAIMQKLVESSKAGSPSQDFMKVKDDINVLTTSLALLQERSKVYYDKLVELKADVSGME